MDPDALGPEHLAALAFMAEAERALALVCRRAHEHIASTTMPGPPTQEEHPVRGIGHQYRVGYSAWWYPTLGLDKKPWNDAWFEWGTQVSNSEAGVQGMFFFAGLSIDKDQHFDRGAARSDWREQLERGIVDAHNESDERIVFRHWVGRHGRLFRVALPQDVLRGTTTEAQGESLGRWVEQTYRALIGYGPPR